MELHNNKIDYQTIRAIFPLKNRKRFEFYLENIFKDLTTVQKGKDIGVSKIKLIDFLKLPIFICEKLFVSMDLDKDGFLNGDELIIPLSKLYFGSFEETTEFIFHLYDFDGDGLITPEDVKMILSFLPLKEDVTATGYIYQLESQAELDEIVKQTFNGSSTLKYDQFLLAIQEKSDIFLQLLCYFYQRCTFKEDSVNMVSRLSSSDIVKDLKLPARKESSSSFLNHPHKTKTVDISNLAPPSLKKLSHGVLLTAPSKNTKFSPAVEFISNKSSMDSDEVDEKIRPGRTDSFKDLNSPEGSGYGGMAQFSAPKKKTKSQFNKSDLEFAKDQMKEKEKKLEEMNSEEKITDIIVDDFDADLEIVEFPDDKEKEELEKKIKYQGMLYKPSKKGDAVEKGFWVVLVDQDIYYYSDDTKEQFINMHNISGSFIKANGEIIIKSQKYYSFSIITENKTRVFITKNRDNAKEWVKQLKNGMGYKNFFEYYEMLDSLGEGQFGQVKLGIKISTKEKVAIKIITKSKLKNEQVELLKSEIDIMKVCKHPNIVQFIDHFENSEYIFIVMEYLQHGHLRQYLAKKNFNVSEKRMSQIAFQVASALKYLHVYGIIHRDLKPDNILVADVGSNFTVKLMDFGLGKILGHKEKTVEGYGTLCFVAPEIILRTPYNNSVDIWSLGISLYYIASRTYPFDSNSDNEIAKKICYQAVEFNDPSWQKKCKELKNLIKGCLEKDMKTRITLDQIITHDFIKINEIVKD